MIKLKHQSLSEMSKREVQLEYYSHQLTVKMKPKLYLLP